MASRMMFAPRCTSAASGVATLRSSTMRSFQTSTALRETVIAAPVKKPVGAFRGGLFGFLLGTSLAGASVYYYILEEYRVSNQLLQEDIYALQASVQRTHSYVSELENKLAQQGGKK